MRGRTLTKVRRYHHYLLASARGLWQHCYGRGAVERLFLFATILRMVCVGCGRLLGVGPSAASHGTVALGRLLCMHIDAGCATTTTGRLTTFGAASNAFVPPNIFAIT